MDTLSALYLSLPWLYYLLLFIFSVMIGSFLNVVIARLPVMLERQWRDEYHDYFNRDASVEPSPTFNLWMPRSRCPNCQTQIAAWDNIPLLSYLWLKGRCRHCQAAISGRYPWVELLAGLGALLCAFMLPPGAALGFALILFWTLLALTFIDLDTLLLPDQLTLPLLWLGLLANLLGVFAPLQDAVIGAIAGYGVLWSLYWGFKLLTGKEGMGYGDFKLLGALGAWLGWQKLPLIVFLAAVVGLGFGLVYRFRANGEAGKPFPFGPALAIAGWIALLWGDTLIRTYLNWVLG